MPLIAKIIADETWLEGERRGQAVDASDRAVRQNVCEVVLWMGAEMRAQALREIAAERMERVGLSEGVAGEAGRNCAAA